MACTLSSDEAFWNSQAPICEPLCSEPDHPQSKSVCYNSFSIILDGKYECDGNELGSTCGLSCSTGSRLDGDPSLVCKENNQGNACYKYFLLLKLTKGGAYWAKSNEPKCIKQCPQRVIHTPPLTVSCTGRVLSLILKAIFDSVNVKKTVLA